MKQSAKQLFQLAKAAHEEIFRQLKAVEQEMKKNMNMVELCDYAYAINESHTLMESSKKELWKLRELSNKLVCGLYLQTDMSSRSIHTDYVTATPDIGRSPNIPSEKSDPAGYKQLMDYLNIPDFGEDENGNKIEPVRPHWPGLVEYIKKLDAVGKPVPPGIDVSKLTPVYKLTLRKKKGVLEE